MPQFQDYFGQAALRPQADIPRSLDQLYDLYLRRKQAKSQEAQTAQAGNLFALEQGFNPNQVTPENIAQAQGPANMVESPAIAAMRQYIERKKGARDLETRKTEAEINKLNASAEGESGIAHPNYQAQKYLDESGKLRIGRFNRQTGMLERNQDDAVAPDSGMSSASDDKFWASQFKMYTPTNATRGSLIGQAAYGNARADRALTTLADPHISPQQIAAVVNDFAGIMTGGVPHADSIREMGFGTLLDDFQNMKTRLSSNPQDANQPEVVAKLKKMVSEIKDVDNKIIANNLDTFEATNSGYIERSPEKWKKIRASVMASTESPRAARNNGVPAKESPAISGAESIVPVIGPDGKERNAVVVNGKFVRFQ